MPGPKPGVALACSHLTCLPVTAYYKKIMDDAAEDAVSSNAGSPKKTPRKKISQDNSTASPAAPAYGFDDGNEASVNSPGLAFESANDPETTSTPPQVMSCQVK